MSNINWCFGDRGDRAAPGGPGTPARAPAAAAEGAHLASGGHGSETAADCDPYKSSRVFLLFIQLFARSHNHLLTRLLDHSFAHLLAHSYML